MSDVGTPRKAAVFRKTSETTVSVELDLDGQGGWQVTTGVTLFDHFLAQLARHGLFDLKISATGDDQHHLVEDVGLCLGRAFDQALEGRQGIVRMGHAVVPMDESLALVAVDISGRGYAVIDSALEAPVGGIEADMVRHFLHSLAQEAKFNLHVQILKGSNDHHRAEATFKSLARALKAATRFENRLGGTIPSTKGTIG
ncbi:MAG: imidazoleglycerol-phosphate dehydratase HisB [Dehalococcoidia bacterium]|jgi:imidazoleglycerol-phosphate dehydratase|nr:imidazoleglycerol-phosphate dehydratase HisB [Dehalococcoidia bacterium]MDP7470230.1 imidazoleglycerol-phosphate dehydratase HisB [Dehalococcoidia bacterium]